MSTKRVISLCIAAGFILACGIIEASDGDLQQYNRPAANAEAANAANALTSALLLPTDGKLISADANGTGKAPVNKGTKALADYVTGVRCAIFGNCAGVNQRTLKSLQIDGTGGAVNGLAAGDLDVSGDTTLGGLLTVAGNIVGALQATIDGRIRSTNGDIEALNGSLIAGNSVTPAYSTLQRSLLLFVGTAVTGSNPARGTSIKNQLRAKNTPKHWIRVSGTGGAVTLQEGAGNWSAAVVDLGGGYVARYRVRVTMSDAMDNANYAVVCTTQAPDNMSVAFPIVFTDTMTTTRFDVSLFAVITGAQGYQPLNAVDFDIACTVMGQQTT